MLTKLRVPNFYGYLILAFWKFDSSEWCATLHEKKLVSAVAGSPNELQA